MAHILQGERKGGKHLLLLTILLELGPQIVIPVIPRLALLALAFCQPLLLRRLLDYLQDPVQRSNPRTGYGLIGAYFLVYGGMAVTQHLFDANRIR